MIDNKVIFAVSALKGRVLIMENFIGAYMCLLHNTRFIETFVIKV